MGRIKTQFVKRITQEVVEQYKADFKDNFEENKKIVSARVDVSSKKLRNTIAGYVTRLIKSQKE